MVIKSIVFADPVAWLKENLGYFEADSVSPVYPVAGVTDDLVARYYDEEEDAEKCVDAEGHVAALAELVRLIDGQELFVGGLTSGMDLLDAGNWDIEVVDAYFQLCYHGEVIYG